MHISFHFSWRVPNWEAAAVVAMAAQRRWRRQWRRQWGKPLHRGGGEGFVCHISSSPKPVTKPIQADNLLLSTWSPQALGWFWIDEFLEHLLLACYGKSLADGCRFLFFVHLMNDFEVKVSLICTMAVFFWVFTWISCYLLLQFNEVI